jgi:hypothetical protein
VKSAVFHSRFTRVIGLAVQALCLAACLSFAPHAAALQSDVQATETGIKAAFLFKFGSYVEWPAGSPQAAGDAFVIGVVEADALADELARVVTGRSIGGRPVRVRKLRRDEPLAGLHMVYIGRTGRSTMLELLGQLEGQPTLTITETDSALAARSMINFVLADGRLRFDASLAPARASGLKISSRLLEVARSVKRPP